MLWLLRAEVPQDLAFIKRFDPALAFTGASADPWLSWSLVLLPVVFFLINLVSRRYGPSVALLSVILSWLVLAGAVQWVLSEGRLSDMGRFADIENGIAPLPDIIAFAVALFAGQILCIYFFEWLDRKSVV